MSASLTAGKVFSTGIAADNIASVNGPALYKTCIESMSKDIAVSTKLEDLNKALAICDVPKYVKPNTAEQ